MFFQSAVVFMMSLYTAATYGILYLLFTTFTFVFKDIYGFSASKSGLAFLGSGVGTLTGLLVVGIASDRNLKKVAAAGRMIKPEDRLPLKLTLPASLCLPIGLLIYGWTADKRVHWMGPQIGNAIIGFGMMSIVMCIQTYLVDAFTSRAASAIAANAVLRSLLGALLPLCGLQLYDALGLGWGNSLLALLTLVLAPVPWCFGHYGERLRLNSRLEKDHSGH
jgi:MFS family permease